MERKVPLFKDCSFYKIYRTKCAELLLLKLNCENHVRDKSGNASACIKIEKSALN